eukprot:GEZU01025384.1.p1 GENE.GEZU01025384.1~~GEZU01025384.1.p1  ORF type:complete len:342 (+),score=93.97 GEZU01025384.1:80-1105(+)
MTWAIQYDHCGAPAEVLQWREDVPKPQPGEGELLVRVLAAPIHPSNLGAVYGWYPTIDEFPRVPGNEGVGVVEAVGAGVTNFTVGQRVVPIRIQTERNGFWQEYTVTPANLAVPVPDAVSDVAASQLVVNPFTAWVMVEELGVKPGEYLLQTAASSTLGMMLIQIAKIKGFKTINVVRRAEQAEELKKLGADEVIVATGSETEEEQKLSYKVKQITGGKGVKYAVDAVIGELGSQVLESMGEFGTVLSYGVLSGKPYVVSGATLLFKELTLKGFWISKWLQRAPREEIQRVTEEIFKHMASGALNPPVAAQYSFKDFKEAVKKAETSGSHMGKVVLVADKQ